MMTGVVDLLYRPAFPFMRPLVGLVVIVSCLWAAGSSVSAQSPVTKDQQGMRESFQRMGSLPWYDVEADAVQPVEVESRIDDSSNRESRWNPKARRARIPNPNAGSAPPVNSSIWQLLVDNFATIIQWIVLIGFVLLFVGLLLFALLKMDYSATGKESSTRSKKVDVEADSAELARLENLPMPVRTESGDFLAEADRLRGLGRLDEAIVYLFGHRLLQLDRSHAIRLARGKTNRQYLAELRNKTELQGVLRHTVDLFEQSFFGKYRLSEGRFDSVRQLQSQFDVVLQSLRDAV